MRRFAFFALLVGACSAPATPPPPPPPSTPPTTTEKAPDPKLLEVMDGEWSGTADVSPFGAWPYRIVFRRGDTAIIAETPPPPGGETALGGYQRLVFRQGPKGPVCDYKASIKEGFSEGTLAMSETTDARLVYCADDCAKMKLVFEKDAEGRLHFETHLAGKLHTDMILSKKTSE